jgi:hypothetical protein
MGASHSLLHCRSGRLAPRALLRAVKHGELGELSELVASEPCLLLQRTESARTAFMTAVQIASADGTTVILQYLLHQLERAAGPHAKDTVSRVVNSRNHRHQTPLIMAASAGHLDAVNILLDMVSTCLGSHS